MDDLLDELMKECVTEKCYEGHLATYKGTKVACTISGGPNTETEQRARKAAVVFHHMGSVGAVLNDGNYLLTQKN